MIANIHPTGAARFIRPERRVQPDIHTLYQVTGDRHVIVLKKDQ